MRKCSNRIFLALMELTNRIIPVMEIPSFEVIFNKYKQRIFALVYHFLKDSHEAEDIAQEVFVRAYRGYKKFRHEAAIYSWLYQIAVNLCQDRVRWQIRQRKKSGKIWSLNQKPEGFSRDQFLSQMVDKSVSTPAETVGNDEIRSRIQEAISLLPDKYARVFILKEIEELSYEEVAQILNISPKIVRGRLIRATEILKQNLEDIWANFSATDV